MDLIYEGITTGKKSRMFPCPYRQNGPDLRRDYDPDNSTAFWVSLSVRMDLIYEGITTYTSRGMSNLWPQSEWTWFTKGLRPHRPSSSVGIPHVRMDLIYEGITTGLRSYHTVAFSRQNGPDLRRDYDAVQALEIILVLVRMDLIYEGITTSIPSRSNSYLQSEWTWFTKGLRPDEVTLFFTISSQNGPDLRRDYDVNWVSVTYLGYPSEWTWFTKGLRHSPHVIEGRDYFVRMDLIYEGITTSSQ